MDLFLQILLLIVGMALLIKGADFFVDNASKIAIRLGMSELLVGLTIVAIGTSLPELVTSIVAGIKGENDIAVGNAIGSSIFNVILILGLSAIIRPMPLKLGTEFDVIIMIISAVVIFVISLFFKKKINRVYGIILVLIYIGYLSYIIIRNVQEANMLINCK